MTRTIALYGGSFDPPHVAHMMVGAHVLATAAVDGLWVIPTWQHPFDKGIRAAFEHRLRMCELAFAHVTPVTVLDIERELGGPSRTLDTVTALAARHPGTRFRLVMGADLLKDTHRWHRFDDLARLAPPLVVGRAGHAHPFHDAETPFDFPAVASSDIRERLAKGAGTDGLLAADVARYIRDHGLYAEP